MQTFEQWWNEIEGYGLRAERFTTPGEAAKAAWDQAMSLRAQADAQPIGKVLSEEEMGIGYDRRTGPVLWFGTPKPGLIYTHPETSAPGLSEFEIRDLAVKYCAYETYSKCYNILRYEIEEDFFNFCRALISLALTRASAATVGEPSDKLDAPAQVGNTVFGKGVEKRLVIEAAQRNHQRTHNPTEEDKRIAAGVESITQLRKQIEAEHDAKSPFQREVEKFGQRECRHCGWLCMPNDAPAKTFYPLEPQAAQQQAEPVEADPYLEGIKKRWPSGEQQAEPGADEPLEPNGRLRFEGWVRDFFKPATGDRCEKYESGDFKNTYKEPLTAILLECWLAAQSGQRAGVAEDAALLRALVDNDWQLMSCRCERPVDHLEWTVCGKGAGNGWYMTPREAISASIAAAAPTQQQPLERAMSEKRMSQTWRYAGTYGGYLPDRVKPEHGEG